MRVIWLCNMTPSAVSQKMGKNAGGGLWVDHVLEDIRAQGEGSLLLLCPGKGRGGQLDEQVKYDFFSEKKPQKYQPDLENFFLEELRSYQPDVIHIWGTEYGHTLAMVNAAKRSGLLDRVVISIQGLCSVYARHFSEGVPEWACRRHSLRDVLKCDNIRNQQHQFAVRGALEQSALEQTRHVIGRTDWDRAATGQIRPDRIYHFCNETLRTAFYQDTWQYEKCTKHRIFASSCAYPVKGFHYLLEAMPLILHRYPDAAIAVTGKSFLGGSRVQKLRRDYYHCYLAKLAIRNGLEEKIQFLGCLDAQQMKAAFLEANVFALPSTIENSPTSLGEAMLLGVPCVAADVGGVRNMMQPGEGFVYQSTAPYMLAEYIMRVFEMQDQAEQMGAQARKAALCTHDPERNLSDLLNIYREIAKGAQ